MSLSYLISVVWRAPMIAVSTAVMGSISLITAVWDSDGNAQLKVARGWAWLLLAFGGVKVKVVGGERVEPSRSYVIVSNHLSYMDTPALLEHLPVNFRFMAKRGLFEVPFIGGHLRQAGHISVPLDDPRAALKVLSHAGQALKQRGLSVLVFPEGGRSPNGELREFKDGAAYLAIKGGVPLLPVCLIGMREVLPMHSVHLRPGKVTLRIGEPIDVSGMKSSDREALTERLKSEIRAMQQLGR
ncbi:MAG: lysophospholipid acyltransferase family protein [Bryobacteraceae bacterium]|jgi:1-acyl-sn-glycerol-3-phosphate acyltransferase